MGSHLKENAKRIEEIIRVLTKYGLAQFIHDSHSDFLKKFVSKVSGTDTKELADVAQPERIRRALAELGPTFIKLGQMLSTRADIVGIDTARELEKLQSKNPADPPEWILDLVEKELGAPPSELFAEFDEEPMGSASIAQVHRAILHNGRKVVVKIQHQSIQEKIEADLSILLFLAELAEKNIKDFSLYQPRETLIQFRKNIERELDFNTELQNLQHFQANFEDDPTVHIPKAYPELSARRVLTMEFVNGIRVQDVKLSGHQGIDPELLAKRCVNIYINMIFRDRFYHADPHPGNLLILEDDVVGLLDFGMVGYLDSVTREQFEGLIEGFVTKDLDLLTKSCLRLGNAPPDLDRDKLKVDVDLFITQYLSGPIKDLDIGTVLEQYTMIVRNHRIIQHTGIQLLIKVLIMLEGTGRHLDPSFNLSEALGPIKQRAMERRFSIEGILQSLKKTSHDWDELIKTFPNDLSDIARRFRRGTIEVNLKHHNLDATANRLAHGLVTAALFVGSTLLWSQRIPPHISGTSIPGIVGVALSGWMAYRLLKAIRRSGGLR